MTDLKTPPASPKTPSLIDGLVCGSQTVKLATPEELEDTYRLRFRIFNEELKEGIPENDEPRAFSGKGALPFLPGPLGMEQGRMIRFRVGHHAEHTAGRVAEPGDRERCGALPSD